MSGLGFHPKSSLCVENGPFSSFSSPSRSVFFDFIVRSYKNVPIPKLRIVLQRSAKGPPCNYMDMKSRSATFVFTHVLAEPRKQFPRRSRGTMPNPRRILAHNVGVSSTPQFLKDLSVRVEFLFIR